MCASVVKDRNGAVVGCGRGASRKAAEAEAARNALRFYGVACM